MPSLAKVRKVLTEAAFNPKTPGPLNIVAHSSGPSYLESRTMEFIMEAQIKRMNIATEPGEYKGPAISTDEYKKKLIRGIQCLTLAIIKVENGEF